MKCETKRARGRPCAFDREQALDTALQLFWQHGYEGTSIAALTDAIGINAPSLYAAFKSKENLYQEAISRYLQGAGAGLSECLCAAQSAHEAIKKLLHDTALSFVDSDKPRGCLIASGLLRTARENNPVAQWTAEKRKLSQEAIAVRLRKAISEGELASDCDADALAAYFASVIQGMSIQAVDGATREQLLRVAELAMNVWPAPINKQAQSA